MKMDKGSIEIIISVLAIFISAYLAYFFSNKSFVKQERQKQVFSINYSVRNFIIISEQVGSIIRSTAQKNNISTQAEFEKNSKNIYTEVSDFEVIALLRQSMEKLYEIGFLEIIESDMQTKDKFVSLFWILRSNKLSDNEKVARAHVLLFDNKLVDNLKKYDKNYLKSFFDNYYD